MNMCASYIVHVSIYFDSSDNLMKRENKNKRKKKNKSACKIFTFHFCLYFHSNRQFVVDSINFNTNKYFIIKFRCLEYSDLMVSEEIDEFFFQKKNRNFNN